MNSDSLEIQPTDRPLIEKGKGLWNADLLIFSSLDSTNRWGIENFDSCQHGAVIWAMEQTAGYGRYKRRWVTHEKKGLTFSIVLKQMPEIPVTMMVGLAVQSALSEFALNALLKWPNDVMLNGKKIAGILAETPAGKKGATVGIGLNVNTSSDELNSIKLLQPATSMLIESQKTYDLCVVLGVLLQKINNVWEEIKNPESLVLQWQKYDFLADKNIVIRTETEKISGTYRGIDTTGKLILEENGGQICYLYSGDVAIVELSEGEKNIKP